MQARFMQRRHRATPRASVSRYRCLTAEKRSSQILRRRHGPSSLGTISIRTSCSASAWANSLMKRCSSTTRRAGIRQTASSRHSPACRLSSMKQGRPLIYSRSMSLRRLRSLAKACQIRTSPSGLGRLLQTLLAPRPRRLPSISFLRLGASLSTRIPEISDRRRSG